MLHVIHMNGKHPIDELFAKGLRHAGATPPPAVWEGISRKRGWRHRGLLQLRRARWALPLVLLLGAGAAGFWALHTPDASTASTGTTTTVTAATPTAPAEAVPAAEQSVSANGTPAVQGNDPSMQPGIVAAPEVSNSTAATVPVTSNPTNSPNGIASSAADPKGHTPNRANTPSTAASVHTPAPMVQPATGIASTPAGPSHAGGATEAAHTPAVPNTGGAEPFADTYVRSLPLETPTSMETRRPLLETPLGLALPGHASATAYVRPKAQWWIGIRGAGHQEYRSWVQGDPELREALNSTERGRRTWGMGLLFGRAWASGLHVGLGAEWVDARYDYRHTDRRLVEHTEVNNYMVSFGSDVLMNLSDTVTTVQEDQQTVHSINRYSTLRLPVEVAMYRPWRRWTYGARVGMAYERSSFREGSVLRRNTAGPEATSFVQSMDVTEVSTQDRVSAQVSATLAFDLRYHLTDRFCLWAGPGYTRGLFAFAAGDQPRPLAERYGLAGGITCTLPGR